MTVFQLIDAINAKSHVPCLEVLVDGRPVTYDVLSVDIDLGYDTVSSSASIVLRSVPSWLAFRQTVQIRLGYDGHLEWPTFVGYIEDDGRQYFPFDNTVKAVGLLRLTQYDYPDEVTYTSQTDTAIVNDLLDKAGITAGQRSIEGEGSTFGVAQDVILQQGSPTWGLINDLDQVTGYKTFDCSDGTVRRRLISGLPAARSAWTYREGENIYSIDRQRSSSAVHNRVVVDGLPLYDGSQAHAERQADSPYVPNPPRYYAYTFQSPLIEEDAYAGTVATRLMQQENRLRDEVELEVPGNPLFMPSASVGVVSARLGLPSETNYWLKHLHHRFDASGFVTRLMLEGGIGDAGYDTDIPPIPAFTWFCDRESFSIGGTITEVYTVTCDGSGSWDPDGTPGALTYAWANNQNADTGTAVTYSTYFTAAQMAGTANVTLTVTDEDGNDASLTQQITGGGTATLARTLYVAGGTAAYCTTDGGQTWNTWAPGGGESIRSVPEQCLEGTAYFGGSSGAVYRDTSYLLATPETLTTRSGAVSSIWQHETDANRVTLGLADGKVDATADATGGTPSWTTLKTYANPVNCVAESPMLLGQYWVCTANELRVSHDGLATDAALATFPAGTAVDISNSFMGNYASASVPSGGTPVRWADGDQALAWGGSATNGYITHHLYDDILWMVSGTGLWSEKPAGTLGMVSVGYIPDTAGTACGTVRHVLRDPGNQRVCYVAASNGVFKTWDGGRNWGLLKACDAYQIGCGSLKLKVTTGRRAYCLGRVTSNGAYTFAYTDNLWAPSPVWVESANNFASVFETFPAAERILLDADGATVYISVRANPGNTKGYVLRNSAVRSGGAWESVLNASIAAGLIGVTAAQIVGVGGADADSSTPGFLAVPVLTSAPAYGYVLHSHDGGTTWSKAQMDPLPPPPGDKGHSLVYDVAIGRNNPNIIYALFGNSQYDWAYLHVSTDKGHFGLDRHIDQDFPWGAAGEGLLNRLYSPPRGNDSEMACLLVGTGSAGGHAYKTTARWLSYSDWGTANRQMAFAPDADVIGGFLQDVTAGDAGRSVYTSADDGRTFATAHTFAGNCYWLECLNSKLWAAAVAYETTGDEAGVYACTSEALNSWSKRNGNLLDIIGVPTRVALDPNV